MSPTQRCPLMVAMALLACSPAGRDGESGFASFGHDEADEGITLGSESHSEESTIGDEGSGEDSSEDGERAEESTTGLKFDLGSAEGSDDNGESIDENCSKVDVVLSVDASSSMEAEIDSLPSTFVLMKDTLATQVGDGITDFRIAVINACPSPPHFHNYAAGDTNCNFPNGRNWLHSDDPMIDQQFACVVDIPFQEEALEEQDGINGGYESQPDFCSDGDDEDEQPALTCAQAVQPGVIENAEFVREDAILLVIAITDEDEAFANVDDAQAIHDLLLAGKGGVENNVTFLGIGGDDCPSAYDGGNVADSQNLAEVAETFGDRGLYRTMCSGQGADPIKDAFEEALTTIVNEACEEFVPEG